MPDDHHHGAVHLDGAAVDVGSIRDELDGPVDIDLRPLTPLVLAADRAPMGAEIAASSVSPART
jgi:hypothetical protein